MKLSEYKRVHCLGIGGIGLSAIARYCLSCGATVSGTDTSSSRITDELRVLNVNIFDKHSPENITNDIDLVIYTIAVTPDNPELMKAREMDITCMTYPEALGLLTKEYKTIAVCGTHGKTTTTAMIAEMMTHAGLSPTVIVGSLLSNGGTNFIKGDSEYLVIEACEYKRSFLNFSPTYIVVTNIDEDHLDYYKDLNDIKSAFQEFTDKLPESGALITHQDVSLNTNAKKINADEVTDEIKLSVLGNHNKENAKLALALAKVLNIEDSLARQGLASFKGTWRRLEYHGEMQSGVKVYDDYGHHPKEIAATLQALREAYPKGEYELNVFFQPHLFSRTKNFLNEFAEVLQEADKVFVLPIYHAREKDDGSVSHVNLADKINEDIRHKTLDIIDTETKAVALNSLSEITEKINSLNGNNVIALTIGAGDVYTALKGLSFK